jgi:hypothetical protein
MAFVQTLVSIPCGATSAPPPDSVGQLDAYWLVTLSTTSDTTVKPSLLLLLLLLLQV